MSKPKTIDQTVSHESPRWYTFENSPNGVSHLYVNRGGGLVTTLCGLSNDPGGESLVAKHCSRCTSRLRAFFEAALVEHEWVRETVTVVVTRPVASDSVQDRVAAALARKTSWQVEGVDGSLVPLEHAPLDEPVIEGA